MQHKILKEHLGPQGDAMVKAVEACVHCGFCLPTCPTYVTMGEEMDSPRGRIILMKEVMEGNLDAELARPYIDHCLGSQGNLPQKVTLKPGISYQPSLKLL